MVPTGCSEQEIIQPDRVHLNQPNPYKLFIVLLFKVGKQQVKMVVAVVAAVRVELLFSPFNFD